MSNTHLPRIITIENTAVCNHKCPYCYFNYKDDYTNTNQSLSKEQIQTIFNKLKEVESLEGKSIVISGGEPFCNRDAIYEIVRLAKENNMFDVGINTNGTLITKKDINFIKESNITSLFISFPSVSRLDYKKITGCDSFDKLISSIKLLKENDVSFGVNVVYSENNRNSFERTMNYISMFTDSISTSFCAPFKDSSDHCTVEDKQKWQSVVFSLMRERKDLNIKVSRTALPCSLHKSGNYDNICFNCPAGSGIIFISETGGVKPCGHDPFGKDYTFGNIFKDNLSDVLSTMGEWKETLASKAPQECFGCLMFPYCMGVCTHESPHTGSGNEEHTMNYDVMFGNEDCFCEVAKCKKELPDNVKAMINMGMYPWDSLTPYEQKKILQKENIFDSVTFRGK